MTIQDSHIILASQRTYAGQRERGRAVVLRALQVVQVEQGQGPHPLARPPTGEQGRSLQESTRSAGSTY
eukprot:616316-Pelagomonas_calceolata.AAC.1